VDVDSLKEIKDGINNNSKKLDNLQNKIQESAANTKERFDKLSKKMKLPEIVNSLTLIVTLHNAALLSKDLFLTLTSIISNGLFLIGLKDEDDQPYNFNEILGKSAEEFLQNLLGIQVWGGLKEDWKKASKVYHASANLYSSMRSMFDHSTNIQAWTAENVSRIGNSLRKNGVVAENSLPPMSENFNKLSGITEAANSLNQVTGDLKDITEEINEFKERKANFETALKEAKPNKPTVNKPLAEEEKNENTKGDNYVKNLGNNI
jgi:hypothetical protein